METAKLSASLLAVKGQAHTSGANSYYSKPVTSIFKAAKFGKKTHPDHATSNNRPSKRIRKSLLLNDSAHNRLRMLAAKFGMSQQQLMEMAVETMLKDAQDQNGCICKLD